MSEAETWTSARGRLRLPILDPTGLTDAQIIKRLGHNPQDGEAVVDPVNGQLITFYAGVLTRTRLGPTAEDVRRPTKYRGQSIPRAGVSAQNPPIVSGEAFVTLVPVPPGSTLTKVDLKRAADAGSTSNFWHAVYSPSRALLAVTDDNGSGAIPVSTSRTLAQPVTVGVEGWVWVATVWVGSGSAPTFYGLPGFATLNIEPPRTTFKADTGLTNPASAPATLSAAGSTAAVTFWVGVQ